MNRNCIRENKARGLSVTPVKIDLISHDDPLTSNEAYFEASRCLGTISCEACDVCRFLCPDLAITRDNNNGKITIDLDYCKGCGICAAICPKGAIKMVVDE